MSVVDVRGQSYLNRSEPRPGDPGRGADTVDVVTAPLHARWGMQRRYADLDGNCSSVSGIVRPVLLRQSR